MAAKNFNIPVKIYFLFILFILYSLSVISLRAEICVDHAILLKATYDTIPKPKIIISWEKSNDAVTYYVHRKLKDETTWQMKQYFDDKTTSYVDEDVESGKGYEYYIKKTTNDKNNNGYGYIYAGINLPVTEYRGKVLVLVDETLEQVLSFELQRLEKDLAGDGWTVSRYSVPRATAYNPWAVLKVKNLITYEFRNNLLDLKSVILIGRVPVPYSGAYAVDGHLDHMGAWPSDVFYSVLTGDWTDVTTRTTTAARPENHNIPLDGKFDQSVLPADAVLQVGRIDFYNLPAFKENEAELLKRYLDKNHNYRHGITKVRMRGLIDDGFGLYSGEAFASNAWMNFASILGVGNIDTVTSQYKEVIKSNSYLWSYACNSGSYNSVAQAAYTDDFARFSANGVFTIFLGSYFGDWDSKDNLLRAAIASSPSIIESVTSGRPYLYFHLMGLGETIGYSTVLSQNNQTIYSGTGTEGLRGTHIALMGDPTIRNNVVNPVKNLHFSSVTMYYDERRIVSLNWDASDDSVLGYNIYRSKSYGSKFVKINKSLVSATFYDDTNNYSGKYIYMVRALKLEKVNSGSYYNQSQGMFAEIDSNTNVPEVTVQNTRFETAPNPASDYAAFYFEPGNSTPCSIEIYDLQAEKINSIQFFNPQPGYNKFIWDLTDFTGNRIPQGIYLCKLIAGKSVKYVKLIVIP